jgi:ERCC4-type nuclease
MTVFIHPNEPREIKQYLISQAIPVKEESSLPFDYLVVVGENRVAVERKEAPDFVQSIIDARLFNQLYYMSLYAPISYLVIIGNITEALIDRNFRRDGYIGALISATIKRAPDGYQGHVNVVNLDTLPDFMLFLKLLHNKLDEGDFIRLPRPSVRKDDRKYLAVATLATLPSIGEVYAKKLIERFGSIYNVVNASYSELAEVLGGKRAMRVYRFLRGKIA